MSHVTIESQPTSDTLSMMQLRQQMGEVVERVFYQYQQFRIMRKDKAMARLVNEDYMQAIDELLETDPVVADTLSLMLNDEAMQIIAQGEREWQDGQRLPLEDVLN